MKERPYQLEACKLITVSHQTYQSSILVMATGLGKTHIASHYINQRKDHGRAMFIAERGKIIYQAQEKIELITGIYPDLEKAGNYANRLSPHKNGVVVATVQTLSKGRFADFPPDDFSTLIIDECISGLSRIALGNGRLVTIKDIYDTAKKIEVSSYNLETEKVESKMVIGRKKTTATDLRLITLIDGTTLKCTAEHKIWTKTGYVLAKDLTLNDVVSKKQRYCTKETGIASIEIIAENIDVYDLEVEGNHNYFANGVLVSNCHHAIAPSYQRVIDHFTQNPACKVLGMTATPDRKDELALGKVFQDAPYSYGIFEAIEDGWLVPIKQRRVFIKELDVSDVSDSMGDLNNRELSALLEFEKPLQKIASAIVEHSGNRKALVFTASVAQAVRTCEIINRWKPGSARYVTGGTPEEVREPLYDDYKYCRFQYLVNVGVATEGFDEPGIEIIWIAFPTKSRIRYAQMMGRGPRPCAEIAYSLNDHDTAGRLAMIAASDKPSVEVVDCVGNSGRHHLITPADILGGKYQDEVVELAEKRVKESSEPLETMSELKKAEAEIARRRREALEAAQRSPLKLRAAFSMRDVNPFDVLGMVPCRIPGWSRDREATKPQLDFLAKLNIDGTKYNIKHASQLISKIKETSWPYGKHVGKQFEEIPKGYFTWWLKQDWTTEDGPNKELRVKVCEYLGRTA